MMTRLVIQPEPVHRLVLWIVRLIGFILHQPIDPDLKEREESSMKILLAVDGSEYSRKAANEIARRPWPAGSTVEILSVIESLYFPVTDTWAVPETSYVEAEAALKEQTQTAINDAEKQIRERQGTALEIITKVVEGHPVSKILDEAESWGADLIVLGSHGYRGLKRFLLGSVSNAVASHAHCSVEIVRSSQTGSNVN
jgi:nucleotide-binding universal stress UspA family protein